MATQNNQSQQTDGAARNATAQESVQLAQAAPGGPAAPVSAAGLGAVQADPAQGMTADHNITRLRVTPGQVIDLPFDGDLQAKLGDQGNLAIKLGDRTIILENYAGANQTDGVIVRDDKGQAVDVASVIASTDPTLDIQTAAGGTAAAAGTPGSGFFSPFAQGSGLGGLGELGVLGGTDLQYQTISPDGQITPRALQANQDMPVNHGVTIGVPPLASDGTLVNEAGLPSGSAHDGSNKTAGAVTITAQDGIFSLSINGAVLTSAELAALGTTPKGIVTPEGVLTLTGWDGSNLSYTYELTTHTSGDTTSDNFTIVVTDANGDQGTATLVVAIHDDVPTAHDDALSVAAGDFNSHSGNVITAAGEDSAAGADIKGADGATITKVGGFSVPAEGTIEIVGQYGILTIQADGSYSYVRDPGTPGGVTDSFAYTLTDGDGDASQATLTIHIGDSGVTVTAPAGDGATVVDEAGLAGGSHQGDSSNIAGGVITVSAPDTVKTLQIGSLSLTATDLAQLATDPKTVVTSAGVLTLTGWDGSHLSYTYELTTHTWGDDATDRFAIVVTDLDGSQGNGSLVIGIRDDVPTANNDDLTIAPGDFGSQEGNVITAAGQDNATGADVTGADGASVTHVTGGHGAGDVPGTGSVTINGLYGTLTIAADGSYSYMRNPHTPGGVTDSFTYTLKDGDGDTSTATLNVHLGNSGVTVVAPTADAETVVNEAGLATGSHHGDGSNIVSGSIAVAAPDGVQSIQVGTLILTTADLAVLASSHQSVTTADGTLTLTGWDGAHLTYTYTLASPTGGDSTSDTIAIKVTDLDGDTNLSGDLVIRIIDDVPTAQPHTGQTHSGQSQQGDLLKNDVFGADGQAAGGGVIGVSYDGHAGTIGDPAGIHGAYGTLYLRADGTYVYKADANATGTDTFTYTIQDGDGDVTSATLTITVDKVTPPTILSSITVDEANQPGVGSNHVSAPNAVSGQLDLAGLSIKPGIYWTEHGVLDLSASGKYTYTLILPYSDGEADNARTVNAGDTFTLQTTDADGNHGQAIITIQVKDDVPTAVLDSNAVGSGATAKGDVTANDVTGADWNGAAVIAVAHDGQAGVIGDPAGIRGAYGTLYLNADGSYSYKADPGASGDDVFTYTLKDGDGDTSTTTLTIHVDKVTPPTITGSLTVDEANQPNSGSHHQNLPNTVSGDLVLNGLSIAAGTYTLPGGHGVLVVEANGHYTYTLTTPYNDGQADDAATVNPGEVFTIPTMDATGNQGSAVITINVKDDVPTAAADTKAGGSGATLTGDVTANDVFGADGKAATGAVVGVATGSSTASPVSGQVGTVIHGTYGDLTLKADGTYSYVAKPNVSGVDHFVYTIQDGDGDKSTATLDITVTSQGPIATAGVLTVDEAALSTGSNPSSTAETAAGDLHLSSGATVQNAGTYQLTYGTLTVNADGSYSYTLTKADPNHSSQGNDTINGADSKTLTIVDGYGNTTTTTVTINIKDDVPTAPSGAMTVDEDALTSGHLGSPGIEGGLGDIGVVGKSATIALTGFSYGADGGKVSFDTTAQPSLTSDGHAVLYRTETATVNGTQVQVLVGYIQYYSQDNNSSTTVDVFKLTVDPTGQTASFDLLQPLDHPNTTTEDNLSLGLKYTVTDGDGDKAVGTITVTVNDDSPTAGTVSSPTIVEPGSTSTTGAASYEIDATNYTGNAHIAVTAGFIDGNGNLITIKDDTPTINTNGAADGSTGLGVTSTTDGSGAARFDEINYLGNGAQQYYSEAMIFSLKDADKVATKATVNLTEFYANEGGVGDEKGAYILYKDGVAVSGWISFEANNTNGQYMLSITGPASGFDEIRFVAIQGSANPNGNAGSDSSDYSVHDVTFNVVDTPKVNTVTGSLPVAFGADGPGAVMLVDGPTSLTYNGVTIVNTLVNGILIGKAGDVTVYSLTLSNDGSGHYNYQFDLAKPFDGTQSGTPLAFHYDVKDNDGDTAHGTINVNVTEGTPTVLQGDIILTNSLGNSITVSDAALLRNDTGSNLQITGTGIKGTDSGAISHSGTDSTYQFKGNANDFTSLTGLLQESGDWGDKQNKAFTVDRSNFQKVDTYNGQLIVTGNMADLSGNRSDADYLAIHLQQGEYINAAIMGAFAGNTDPVNVQVSIYDSNGNLLASSGYQTASHFAEFTASKEGDYYFKIDAANGNGTDDSGNYQLTLKLHTSSETDGSFHYTTADGSEATATVHGVSGGTSTGNDQHRVMGTDANEILVGDHNQHNYLNGGGGEDWIMYQPGDEVDGGGHSHSSSLAGSYLGDVLDISEIAGIVDLHGAMSKIHNIDTISMTGGGNQSVSLNLQDVLDIGQGTFQPTSAENSNLQSKDAVKVEGNAGDMLTLDSGTGNGQWVNITDHINNAPAGHQVFAYDQNGGSFDANDVRSYVLVSNNVTVHDQFGHEIAAVTHL